MKLNEDQKKVIEEENKEGEVFNLKSLTQKVFGSDELDGRSRESKALVSYLKEKGYEYTTNIHVRLKPIKFNQEQKDIIIEQARLGVSSLEIAKGLFPDKDIAPLSNEQRCVLGYIREFNPDFWPTKDGGALEEYTPPRAMSRVIMKINAATGEKLVEGKLNRQKTICVQRLQINLCNSRFLKIINNYINRQDRELFEQEFVRLTWDKPDLTADEINLYLNVCKEIINLEVISAHLNKLNEMFDVADDQTEMTVRLAEIIKTKSQEYHQCENRIENLTKKLQGDRSARLLKNQKQNASFLTIVQAFQEEEERQNMLKMAEMQRKLVKKEALNLENMQEWQARILGLSMNDIV